MRNLIVIAAVLAFLAANYVAYAAPVYRSEQSILPTTDNLYHLGSTSPDRTWAGLHTEEICLAGSCRTSWPSGGGGGSGNVGTSSAETSTRVPFWTSTAATPATLSGGNAGFTFNTTDTRLTVTNASTTAFSATTVCLTGDTCRTTWPTGGASLTGTTGQVAYFSGVDTAVGTSTIFIDTDEQVGIGTTSPYAKLSVDAPGGTAPYFAIGSSSGEALRISPAASPKVGIGTTSPWKTLSVSGEVFIDSTAANAFSVGTEGTTTRAFNIDTSGTLGNGVNIITSAAGSGVQLNAASANVNEVLTVSSKGTSNLNLAGGTGGSIVFQPSGVTRYQMAGTFFNMTPTNRTATTPFITYTGGAGSTLNATAESTSILFDLTNTQTHASGAIGINRDIRIRPTTHAYPSGTSIANSTIATSSTFQIDGGPLQGAFNNYTHAIGLYVSSTTAAYTTASTTNASAIYVEAPRGAANNYTQFNSSAATTTIRIDSTSATQGGCIEMKDFDGSGFSYITVSNGVMTVSATSCK